MELGLRGLEAASGRSGRFRTRSADLHIPSATSAALLSQSTTLPSLLTSLSQSIQQRASAHLRRFPPHPLQYVFDGSLIYSSTCSDEDSVTYCSYWTSATLDLTCAMSGKLPTSLAALTLSPHLRLSLPARLVFSAHPNRSITISLLLLRSATSSLLSFAQHRCSHLSPETTTARPSSFRSDILPSQRDRIHYRLLERWTLPNSSGES